MNFILWFGSVYLAAGLVHVLVRRTWHDAIYGVREGAGIIDDPRAPTPLLLMVLTLIVGLPADILCWPYNEWMFREDPL